MKVGLDIYFLIFIHEGSWPIRIMAASITFITSWGGFDRALISASIFLFRPYRAFLALTRKGLTVLRASSASEEIYSNSSFSLVVFSLRASIITLCSIASFLDSVISFSTSSFVKFCCLYCSSAKSCISNYDSTA